MNGYVMLDWKRYATTAKTWIPRVTKPSTVRLNVDGSVDATYGSGILYEWAGDIKVPITSPGPDWGTVDNLRASLKKLAGLPFQDHYGSVLYTVHVNEYKERSLSPKWDSPSNEILFTVKLVGA